MRLKPRFLLIFGYLMLGINALPISESEKPLRFAKQSAVCESDNVLFLLFNQAIYLDVPDINALNGCLVKVFVEDGGLEKRIVWQKRMDQCDLRHVMFSIGNPREPLDLKNFVESKKLWKFKLMVETADDVIVWAHAKPVRVLEFPDPLLCQWEAQGSSQPKPKEEIVCAESNDIKGLSDAAIGGAVTAGVVALILIGAFVFSGKRRENEEKERKQFELRSNGGIVIQDQSSSNLNDSEDPKNLPERERQGSALSRMISRTLGVSHSDDEGKPNTFTQRLAHRLRSIRYTSDTAETPTHVENASVMSLLWRRKNKGKAKMIYPDDALQDKSQSSFTVRYLTEPPPRNGGASSRWKPPGVVGTYYKSITRFSPGNDDEMELKKGDILLAEEFFEDGWMRVKRVYRKTSSLNTDDGFCSLGSRESGIIPGCYVISVAKLPEELLLGRYGMGTFSMMIR